MILTQTNPNHTNAHPQTTTAFTIATTPEAFQILSGNLYENRHLAILRELCTNAHDAHVSIQNPDPIQIQFPGQFQSELAIIDHGPGMSDADIRTLYTTYFGSDKRDSNIMVGALGLGSKSPLSLYESFTVSTKTSHESVGRQYIVHLSQTGTPQITYVSPIAHHTGTTISMTIPQSDQTKFRTYLPEVTTFMEPMPQIDGLDPQFLQTLQARHDQWLHARHRLSDHTYYALASQVPYNNKSLYEQAIIVQGNVPYPVPYRELQFSQNSIPSFIITVPIGSVTPAASRETLSLTPQTTQYLRERILHIHKIHLNNERLRLLMVPQTIHQYIKSLPERPTSYSSPQRVHLPHFLAKRAGPPL